MRSVGKRWEGGKEVLILLKEKRGWVGEAASDVCGSGWATHRGHWSGKTNTEVYWGCVRVLAYWISAWMQRMGHGRRALLSSAEAPCDEADEFRTMNPENLCHRLFFYFYSNVLETPKASASPLVSS